MPWAKMAAEQVLFTSFSRTTFLCFHVMSHQLSPRFLNYPSESLWKRFLLQITTTYVVVAGHKLDVHLLLIIF